MPSFDQCVAHFLFADFLSGIWFVCPALQPALDGMAKANSFSSPAAATPPAAPPTPAPVSAPPPAAESGRPAGEGVKVGDSGTG